MHPLKYSKTSQDGLKMRSFQGQKCLKFKLFRPAVRVTEAGKTAKFWQKQLFCDKLCALNNKASGVCMVLGMRIVKRQWRESIRNESGTSSFRALVLSILLTLLFGQTMSWATGLLMVDPNTNLAPPNTSPFVYEPLSLPVMLPETPAPAFQRLMAAVSRLQTKSFVPYVFGGNAIGSPRVCQACSECVMARKLPANSSSARTLHCEACRRCGLDCSNFVNRVFDDADMGYRFADTSTLRGLEDMNLEARLGFVNMGNHIEDARAGDVLLQKNHVILLLAIDHVHHTVDYIHASRGSRRTPVGGIERVRAADMFKVTRHVEKILRHRELIQPEDHVIPLSQTLLKELQTLVWRA